MVVDIINDDEDNRLSNNPSRPFFIKPSYPAFVNELPKLIIIKFAPSPTF